MTKNLFLNKQIILATGMIVFIVAAVIGGTGAFFSDTETSTGNVFTAGAVNIAITGIAHTPSDLNSLVGYTTNTNGMSFSFSDLKPLDKGTVTYTLNNTKNEAFVCAMVKETGNHDNGTNGPEIAAGDTTGGAGEGELGQFLNFKFGTQSGSLSAISGVWQTVGTIASPGTLPAAIDYCFGTFSGNNCVLGTGNYNLAQTDSLTANVEFYAVQTRNNSGFTCASLNPPVTYVNTSSVLNLSNTGWAGWSCNAGDTAIGATVYQADGVTVASPASYTGQLAGVGTVWPHYTFGANETGYVIQNGGSAQQLVVAVQCQVN